ncbi:MAG: carboxylesterase/lipase family protein [Actinobacteria bacterium]|nr:carboxylesterase/lipase family protein [Actinomycetota bacterium]
MTANIPSGAVTGARVGEVDRFLGIPYAAAPTGTRRWAPPEPVPAWDGELDATSPGPAPPQPERPINEWFHGPLVATDEAGGLSLNVFAPRGEGSRPVLVWLHGGGWAVGWSTAPIFDGAALAAALDAVVVTVNYRLGSLGWLHHPELGAPGGDWGFLDQALALRWVRDSIAPFGGDPTRVTLAGQSAGAGSVLHLLTSPAGEGLFARALALSPPLGEAVVPAALGVEWAEALGERLVGGLDLDAMRAIPADTVVAAHEELLTDPRFRGTRGGAMPIVLPGAIEHDPFDAATIRPEIPLLIGHTADEATFLFRAAGRWLDPDERLLTGIVSHQRGVDDPAATIAAYRAANPEADGNELLCRIVTDKLFAEPVADYAAARAAAGAEVYRLRIDHIGPDERLGATHAIDVPLLFGTYARVPNARAVSGDGPAAVAASAALQEACRAFVHGEPPWPAAEQRVIDGVGRPPD